MPILRRFLTRLATAIPTLLFATLVVFSLQHIAPGDAAVLMAGENADPKIVEAVREREGLNDPLIVQYGRWLGDAVTGDLGTTLRSTQPVTELIGSRLPASISIWTGSLVVSLGLGIPFGIWAASRRGRITDAAVSSGASVAIAMPSFWLGMMLVIVFSLKLGWLPATGWTSVTDDLAAGLKSLVLPSLALGLIGAAEVCRQVRSSMIEVLAQPHIRTLRAKGLPRRSIVWKHAWKGASLPIVSVVGLLIGRIIGGSIIVENVFGIPGIGTLVISSINFRDFPVVQGVVLFSVVSIMAINFLADLVYGLLDPRIRVS